MDLRDPSIGISDKNKYPQKFQNNVNPGLINPYSDY